MKRSILAIVIVLLSGCGSLFPAPTPPHSNLPVTTRPAAAGTPTRSVTIARPLEPPTVAATISPTLEPFSAALLPEFRNDLALVHSPTIYHISLTLDAALQNLAGQETVTFTNRTNGPLSDVFFRLFPNYTNGGAGNEETISRVSVNGAQATPSLESANTALRVPLAVSLPPNGAAEFNFDFNVSIPVSNTTHYADFTDSEGIITLPSVYPMIPAYDEKGWHTELPPPYGDLVYADASVYDVTFTAPATMTVIASGSTIGETSNGSEKTWHFVGGPMRDFDFNVSSDLKISTAQVGQVTVNSYYLPKDESGGKNVLKWATRALEVYNDRIGLYPFQELDVVETPTTAGGIEYPGCVVISSELYRDPKQSNFFEFAVVHEVAHQWWYAQVGDDQVNNPWMDESLAQYTSLIYYQDAYGQDVGNRILDSVFQGPYNDIKKNNQDKPAGLPVLDYSEKQYSDIVYGKGPLFFDAVRTQVGDETFFKFLQSYYQRYKYQIAKPEDMLATMEQVSGQNLDAIYRQWITGP